jgi:hypothetical protein
MGWIGQAEVRIYDEFTRGFRRRDFVYDTTRRAMPHKGFDNQSGAFKTTHWIAQLGSLLRRVSRGGVNSRDVHGHSEAGKSTLNLLV